MNIHYTYIYMYTYIIQLYSPVTMYPTHTIHIHYCTYFVHGKVACCLIFPSGPYNQPGGVTKKAPLLFCCLFLYPYNKNPFFLNITVCTLEGLSKKRFSMKISCQAEKLNWHFPY